MPSSPSLPVGRPLVGLRVALLGPGRVGASLAAWAVAAGARLEAVAGHGDTRARELAGRLGGHAVGVEDLPTVGCDLLLIAVPDPRLAEVAERLGGSGQTLATVALHSAGSLGAEVLAPLARCGVETGTFHPLKAFPRQLPDLAEAAGTFFATDGSPAARALAHRLAQAFGGEAGEVPGAARDVYHLAASLAAGGVTTLVALAAEIAAHAGLPAAVGRGYLALARGALAAAASAPTLAGAITGPVARGDLATLERELASLAALGPPAAGRVETILQVARETARLTGQPVPPSGPDAAHLDPPPGGC